MTQLGRRHIVGSLFAGLLVLCLTWSSIWKKSDSHFCTSVAAALDAKSLSVVGGGAPLQLDNVDLSELSDKDRQEFTAAVTQVESTLAVYLAGRSSGGWSTQPVADVASRVCHRTMPVVNIVN